MYVCGSGRSLSENKSLKYVYQSRGDIRDAFDCDCVLRLIVCQNCEGLFLVLTSILR